MDQQQEGRGEQLLQQQLQLPKLIQLRILHCAILWDECVDLGFQRYPNGDDYYITITRELKRWARVCWEWFDYVSHITAYTYVRIKRFKRLLVNNHNSISKYQLLKNLKGIQIQEGINDNNLNTVTLQQQQQQKGVESSSACKFSQSLEFISFILTSAHSYKDYEEIISNPSIVTSRLFGIKLDGAHGTSDIKCSKFIKLISNHNILKESITSLSLDLSSDSPAKEYPKVWEVLSESPFPFSNLNHLSSTISSTYIVNLIKLFEIPSLRHLEFDMYDYLDKEGLDKLCKLISSNKYITKLKIGRWRRVHDEPKSNIKQGICRALSMNSTITDLTITDDILDIDNIIGNGGCDLIGESITTLNILSRDIPKFRDRMRKVVKSIMAMNFKVLTDIRITSLYQTDFTTITEYHQQQHHQDDDGEWRLYYHLPQFYLGYRRTNTNETTNK